MLREVALLESFDFKDSGAFPDIHFKQFPSKPTQAASATTQLAIVNTKTQAFSRDELSRPDAAVVQDNVDATKAAMEDRMKSKVTHDSVRHRQVDEEYDPLDPKNTKRDRRDAQALVALSNTGPSEAAMAPIVRSPTRRATEAEDSFKEHVKMLPQADNWKNSRGTIFTLEERLEGEARTEVVISDQHLAMDEALDAAATRHKGLAQRREDEELLAQQKRQEEETKRLESDAEAKLRQRREEQRMRRQGEADAQTRRKEEREARERERDEERRLRRMQQTAKRTGVSVEEVERVAATEDAMDFARVQTGDELPSRQPKTRGDDEGEVYDEPLFANRNKRKRDAGVFKLDGL